MGRWRPPQAQSAKYITPEGYSKLDDELKYLWTKKRREVTKALQTAAAEGDRSENAEYIYRKKQLREIDSRIRYISKRLDDMNVVEHHPADTSKIYFGAWVELEDEEGVIKLHRIVGADEIGDHEAYISLDSPVAKSLLKKSVTDKVNVKTPAGTQTFSIISIEYK